MEIVKLRKETLVSEIVYYGNKIILIMEYLFNFFIKFVNLNDFSDGEQEYILEEFRGNIDFLDTGSNEDEFYENHKVSLLCVEWYNFNDDLLELSKKIPKLKFYVDVYGEGECNIQRVYYYKGDSQIATAEINFEKCLLW